MHQDQPTPVGGLAEVVSEEVARGRGRVEHVVQPVAHRRVVRRRDRPDVGLRCCTVVRCIIVAYVEWKFTNIRAIFDD